MFDQKRQLRTNSRNYTNKLFKYRNTQSANRRLITQFRANYQKRIGVKKQSNPHVLETFKAIE